MITDKSVVMQIFGNLMKNPLLLSDTKYSLTPNDFYSKFEKYIFGAIYNLYLNGIEKITIVDIDNYLQNHKAPYKNFNEHNGIDFLQDCEEISVDGNFDFYYNKLKKYNLLNDLKQQGFNISEIYPEELLDKNYNEKKNKFETMTIQDIFNLFRKKISNIETQYQKGGDIKKIKANDGIEELLANIKASPDVGSSLQGKIYNTVVRGARLGKYYIRSADSGVGKTRSMVGDACGLAYPFRYNQETLQWEFNGSSEKVVYIGTEQEPQEIQTLVLSYLTGINEEKILYGFYNKEEEEIIQTAQLLMNYFQNNLIIMQIPDPDIQSIKATIRQIVLEEDVNFVFYDYIFSSPALMREFSDIKLREDVILMMLSTALKDIAVELNVFLETATQVTINDNERKGMKTKASIRGAKSIADKADVGCIISLINQEDREILDKMQLNFKYIPNQVTDIYKNRRGRYNSVRIWSYFDAGTCRRIDLFITNDRMEEITDFNILDCQIQFDNLKELEEILQKINNRKEVNKEKTKWSELI